MTDTELLAACRAAGISVAIEGEHLRIRAPKGTLTEELRARLSERKEALRALLQAPAATAAPTGWVPEPTRRHEPFPLTELQQAYVAGRDGSYGLGGACQAYCEFDGPELDLGRLERAWQRVVAQHEALRTVVLPDLQQVVRPVEELPLYRIAVSDLRTEPEAARAAQLQAVREQMSTQVRPLHAWPLFELRVSRLPAQQVRVHVAIELLLIDAASVSALFTWWQRFYDEPERPVVPQPLALRDYVLGAQAAQAGPAWQRAWAYWRERAPSLPSGPELPTECAPAELPRSRIVRHAARLPAAQWQRLRAHAAARSLTPAVALCAAWAEVLARWSSGAHFTLNLTLFQRQPIHPAVGELLGDFTSTLLLEYDGRLPSHAARAQKLAAQLLADLEHSVVSGLQVQRERTRSGHADSGPGSPLVFTSLLGLTAGQRGMPYDWLGRAAYLVSQTPQIWIDHQVYEEAGDLVWSWDVAEDLFPAGLIADMRDAYAQLLLRLADDEASWEAVLPVPLPAAQTALREAVNATSFPWQPGLLHQPVRAQAQARPDAWAVLSDRRCLRYGELWQESTRLAVRLQAAGVRPRQVVAVVMQTGWEQVVACLAIIRAGAAYLPVDADLPPLRRGQLLQAADAAVTQPWLADRVPPELPALIVAADSTPADLAEPEVAPTGLPTDLAYVIYTSGSTGQPKGVMIEHQAALNTVLDLNARFGVGPADRVLGVSALSFDLSVYDLFGTLAAGAALVLPAATERDPGEWARLGHAHGVTIWNSVPALLQLLVEEAGRSPALPPLRLLLLSGDWIPLALPEQARALWPAARAVSLGGATEAAIWSIYHEIDPERAAGEPGWRSVPYGRPLRNQSFHVKGAHLQEQPDWVPGELYIGGQGLARGYLGDPQKTAERFVTHDGARLYRTGDLGRRWPDGRIELLGRADLQVKIAGHRVELGEIEGALMQHPAVAQAVVVATGPARGPRHLLAYVVAAAERQEAPAEAPEVAAVRARSDELARTLRAQPALQGTLEELERAAVKAMAWTLRQLGAFTRAGERLSVEDLLRGREILPQYRRLLSSWLGALAEDGLLRREADGAFRCPEPLPAEPPGVAFAHLAKTGVLPPTLVAFCQGCAEQHLGLLAGRVSILQHLFPAGSWEVAEAIYEQNPAAALINQAAAALVAGYRDARAAAGPLRVLELGAGTGGTTAALLAQLRPEDTEYTYTDLSHFFFEGARRKFAAWPGLRYRVLDIQGDPLAQGYTPESADLIVAANVLHNAHSLAHTLSQCSQLLTPAGLMVIVESTREHRFLTITAGFLQDFGGPSSETRDHLLPPEAWRAAFAASQLVEVAAVPSPGHPLEALGQHVFVVRRRASAHGGMDSAALRSFLQARLPAYMVPETYVPLAALPLSRNGKVDRGALPAVSIGAAAQVYVAPRTETEQALARIWQEVLAVERVSINDRFLALGGDSLQAIRVARRVATELGVALELPALLAARPLAELARRLEELRAPSLSPAGPPPATAVLPAVQALPEARYQPFPLTEVQQAYWVGRQAGLHLGGVACHVYYEVESETLEVAALEAAWQRLIHRHDMLRAVLRPDGQQQVLPPESVPPYRLTVRDLQALPPAQVEQSLLAVREALSHQVRDLAKWPLFELQASLLPEGRVRVHVALDVLPLDGFSLFLLMREWQHFYRGPAAPLPPLDLTFRDYVLALQRLPSEPATAEAYARDLRYWQQRAVTLPPGPALPLRCEPSRIKAPRFERRQTVLAAADWQRLRAHAAAAELTPSGLLLAAYSAVLQRFSQSPHFSLNLTRFNRLPVHPQVEQVVGDFTSLVLVEIAAGEDGEGSFREHAQRVQRQLFADLEHGLVSGVTVIRQLLRRDGQTLAGGGVLPVVLTSAVGLTQSGEELGTSSWLGKEVFSVSQTPQIWLDHQAWQDAGRLVLCWDAVAELFPDGLLDAMFTAYRQLLAELATEAAAWHRPLRLPLPAEQQARRAAVNETSAPWTPGLLHDPFLQQAQRQPMAWAVLSDRRCLRYGELLRESQALAERLQEAGVAAGSLVVVALPKGWEQVVACLGIGLAGAAYLPLDPELPALRVAHILQEAQPAAVVTLPELLDRFAAVPRALTLHPGAAPMRAPVAAAVRPDQLAYVIYTSGSTGRPKGVMVEHQAALNTLLDINERFGVGPADRVLGVSALSFDLSVYDVFGVLAAGGALVLPSPAAERDPAQWLRLMRAHDVTVWNSVPALFQLLVEAAAGAPERLALRLAMLSGDWIPLPLPAQGRGIWPELRVISLGGATEAAIWSIYYEIGHEIGHEIGATGESGPEWSSIPYGLPLRNQRWHVLGPTLQEQPDWVAGELYIAGCGLARGYLADPQQTQERFLLHPQTGERLYRTGDLGRYWPDGRIELLGRIDDQVKISGYRIELGEVAAALQAHPGVAQAVAVAVGEARARRQLCAYFVPQAREGVSPTVLREFLQARLPAHMVPAQLVALPMLPLSSNGKVDRAALARLVGSTPAAPEAAYVAPSSELEVLIARLWSEVLHVERVGVADQFIQLGGDSLLAFQVVGRLTAALGVRLELPEFLAARTLAELAQLLEERLLLSIEALSDEQASQLLAPTEI